MNIIKINDQNSFSWRETPWDTAVFLKKTAEIFNFKYENEQTLQRLFMKMNDLIQQEKIEILCFRHDSSDQTLKKVAFENEFNLVEHSYIVSNNISKIQSIKRNLTFRKPTKGDISSIQHIVKESFEFGRFHEDPFIDIEFAKKRYENWISQLIEETNFFVLDINNEVAGFFNYVVKDNYIDFPLSGIDKKYAGIGSFMWHKMFNLINDIEKIKQVRVMISASNLGVLNLLVMMGFRVHESTFGYHKHIKR